MIELNRSKENKWIFQKNINNLSLLIEFLEELEHQDNLIDNESIKVQLQQRSYNGRSDEGSSSTMGVRLSQTCFYMFGYKIDGKFFPSPMTKLLLSGDSQLSKQQIGLINLYSMQFPTPFSDTSENFRIYVGRLFIKLLLDKRLDEKLYIDECIFFLMFLEEIDQSKYEDLINSILIFRELPFELKENMFKAIDDYNDVFSNVTHEMKYYFIKIFKGFGVFNVIGDRNHNQGNLLKFIHGNNSATRTDAYTSRGSYSGYITLEPNIKEDAIKLNNEFNAFDLPESLEDYNVFSREEWIRDIYQFKPLEYIDIIMETDNSSKELIESIQNMVYHSRYGTNDGKSFEDSLQPFFYLFKEARNVEIISGPGQPDLFCVMDDDGKNLYKITIDAKKTQGTTSSINPVRINNHRHKYGAQYAIVISPRFARGVKSDIENYPIVTIEAETLADYCLNSCLYSSDYLADFSIINGLIVDNLGTDITKSVNKLIEEIFELKEN